MVTLLWPAGPVRPVAGPGEVHVWAADLERTPAERAGLFGTLSPDERARAARYAAPGVGDQFVVARGLLRALLGRYFGLDPAALRFGTAAGTKPGLTFPPAGLFFNVSHSRAVALFAVSARGEVGVDVEQCRAMPTHRDLAERFFTPAESRALAALPAGESEEAFFRVWTRKEAFLKLTGLGLSGGLESFEVSVGRDEPARLLRLHGEPGPAARYALENLTPADDYRAALAVEGADYRLTCWSLG